MQNNAKLKFTAMVVLGRVGEAKDSELYGSARALGDCTFDIMPMLPELLDQFGTGIRRKIEFRRAASQGDDQEGVVVGRGSCTLKLVGDYLSKFDSVAEGMVGAPKKAVGEAVNLEVDVISKYVEQSLASVVARVEALEQKLAAAGLDKD